MIEWNKEDKKYMQKMLSVTEDGTMDWLERKTRDLSAMMIYYKCAIMEIETKFKVLNEQYSLEHDRNPINSIKSRLKSPRSIKEKLYRYDIPVTPESIEENLNDIAGVRVVCSFQDDVYSLAEALLNQDDVVLIEKKDYIANPKPNGYRSLHMIVAVPVFLEHEKKMVKVEIQLRTIAMDCWASLEHQMRYKKDVEFTDEMAADLYECANLSVELDMRMNNLRKQAEQISK